MGSALSVQLQGGCRYAQLSNVKIRLSTPQKVTYLRFRQPRYVRLSQTQLAAVSTLLRLPKLV